MASRFKRQRRDYLPATSDKRGHVYLNGNTQFADILPPLPYATVSHAYFSDVESLASHCDLTPNDFWHDTYRTTGSSFTGGISLETAIAMARNGWSEGADKAAAIAQTIQIEAPTKRRMSGRAVAGAFPVIPRYLGGDLECMITPQRVGSSPVITLVVNMTGSWQIAAGAFVNRAAVIAALVDAIESAGYQTDVVCVFTSAYENFAFEGAVSIKAPGEALDLTRVAFAAGHVAFFRQMWFKLISADSTNEPLGSGLGRVIDYDRDTIPQGTYLLPQNLADFGDEKSARTYGLESMVQALRDQHCPAFPSID